MIGYLNEDGTATVTGSVLPVDEAAAACAHVEELARAAKRAGWGPVTAEVARTVVVAQRAVKWRYALTDPAGQLLLAGITRRRPHRPAPAGELPPCRDGIVELQLPAARKPPSTSPVPR